MELSYSTDPNWCAKCKHLPCVCNKVKKIPRTSGTGTVKMRREKRRGKALIVVFETRMTKTTLQAFLKEIRKSCGAGGTVKKDTLEIQGDHRDKIQAIFEAQGIKVVRAGG
jgi:translation initiation factor 1